MNANDINRTALLPCPFCGSHAEIKEGAYIYSPRVQVECSSCRIATFYYDEPVAIKQWNRRAQPIEPTIESQLDSVSFGKLKFLMQSNKKMHVVGVIALDDATMVRATIDMGRVTFANQTPEPQIDGYPLWSGLPPPVERVALSGAEIEVAANRCYDDVDHISGSDDVNTIAHHMRLLLAAQADNTPFAPDWVNYRQGLADGKADAIEALQAARPYVVSQNQAEGMLEGFSGRKQRPSDADLQLIDAAIAVVNQQMTTQTYMQSTDAENVSKTGAEINIFPPIGSQWLHTNGDTYTVMHCANRDSDRPDYPPTVVYHNTHGKIYAKPLATWYRSRTLVDAPITQPLIAEAARDSDLLDALETGLECAQEVAADTHAKYAGYKPHKHAAVDADVAKIEKAIAAVKLDDVAGDAKDAERLDFMAHHGATLRRDSDGERQWYIIVPYHTGTATDAFPRHPTARKAIDAAIAASTKK